MEELIVNPVLVKGKDLSLFERKKMSGEYYGHRSGYVAWFEFKGDTYTLETTRGVRGINVRCIISIEQDGNIIIKS